MHRRVSRLADGRELVYYGTRAVLEQPTDARDLGDGAPRGELRYDALEDEWVAVAGHRQGRTFLPSSAECPLCPSAPGRATEIPAEDFEVVVFENRFPSFQDPGGEEVPPPAIGAVAPNAGRCEVVVFAPDHDASFGDLEADRVRLVLDALADRTESLMALDHVAHVFPFENRGEEIGVTLRHPHGQVYGYPYVAPRARARLEAAARHREATRRDLVADLVDAELADGPRVVAQTEHWVAFVPFAARWPFQVQAHPRRDVRDLPSLNDEERDDVAALMLDVVRRFDGLFGLRMPYVAGWFQAPKGPLREHARLHWEVFSNRRAADRLKYLAGSESAMGAWVNDVRPEEAARMLREALP